MDAPASGAGETMSDAPTPHRWGRIETRFSTFAAWVDTEGRLTRFRLRSHDAAAVDRTALHDERAIADVRRQIEEYCAGKREVFDIERAARGSPFQHEVWQALMEIPFGATTSYGAIARVLGYPNGARAVGHANATNPIALIVPCHRVIGADGSLTGYGGGLAMKRALLAHEAACSPSKGDLFAVG
jgi:methylated-DNA-[protein]-cysteine S-methyltransferase